jgi:hypothetical protein
MNTLKNLKDLRNKTVIATLILFIFIFLFGDRVFGQDIVQVPRIKKLCVNTGDVYIEWEKSLTPGVNYYTIYYKYIGLNPNPDWKELQGIQISASDPPFYSFSPALISEVDPTSEPVAFAIQAHTDTLESLVDDRFWAHKWDSTMYLEGSYSTCLASIELSWNSYDFNLWPHTTKEYRVYTSANGAAAVLNTTVPANQTSVTLTNLIANNDYDIFVAAIPSNGLTSDSATSTTLRINTNMPALPEYIHADYATYLDNKVDIQFTVDPNGQLEKYKLLRSKTLNGTYDTIAEIETSEQVVQYTDNVNYIEGPYFYKLVAINHCDIAIRESQNIASSIILSNSGQGVRPELNWSSYENWINGVSEYVLERQTGDNDFEVITQTDLTNYTDDELAGQQGSGMGAVICYRITAYENDNIYGQNASSVSNTICVELPVNIRFEYDAFTPGNSLGNNSFGPLIDYVPDEYEFNVLDRSGRKVFESKDARNSNWDGRHNGQLVPQGAYMYVLQYRVNGGKKHTIRGGVVVVYTE